MQGNKLIYKTFKKHELPLLVVYEKEIELYFNNFSDSIQQVLRYHQCFVCNSVLFSIKSWELPDKKDHYGHLPGQKFWATI